MAHTNLGVALRDRGQPDEAIKEYRAAIKLDPKNAKLHSNLGNALLDRGQPDEAIREHRAAIELDPKLAPLHYNLGNALFDQKQLDEAIREYRVAITLDPKLAVAHGALGQALLQLGRFVEAREAMRRCLDLPAGEPLRPVVTRLLQQYERSIALDQRAAALLKGEAKAKNPSELLKLGRFCLDRKKAPAAAARLYASAFQAESSLADDLDASDRFAAAKAAALAGCGKGNDAASVDEPGRSRWRKQALDWLRADLKLWTNRLKAGDADDRDEVRQALERWWRAPDLADLRSAVALEGLPEDEQLAWGSFWAEVAALLKRAG
jgi:Tfp pilus assembly protein PilF